MIPIRALLIALAILCAALPAWAGTLEIDTKTVQGGLLFGRVDPGARVSLDGAKVMVAEDGRFIVGFGRAAKKNWSLSIRHPDKNREKRAITVAKRTYQEQRIKGLSKRKVSPNQKDLERIKTDNAGIGKARARRTKKAHHATGFIWPVQGIITGVWGTKRFLNGKPRSPHNGVDIAAPDGTPIVSPADGVIALVNKDMFFTGMTIMIDHGQGLTTVYAHMSRVDVEEGQAVRQGETVGAVGATGRATGPHLHWGMTWKRTHVDPSLVVPPMPPQKTKKKE